jgi:hypothetical protein
MQRTRIRRLLALLLLLQAPGLPASDAVVVDVPIRFEARYLDNLLADTVFVRRAALSIWGDDSGCNDLTLSNPVLQIENGKVQVVSDAHALTGLAVGDRCLRLVDWAGKIRALQRVDIIDPAGIIAFSTEDTTLLDSKGNPATVSNRIWQLADDAVYPHLDRLRIDLTAAVDEVRTLLPLFLPDGSQQQVDTLLKSFHLDHLSVESSAVTAVVSFSLLPGEIAESGFGQADGTATRTLDDNELARFVEQWERLDAFLGFVIKAAAREGLSPSQKDTLFDTLIEMRYSLVEALTDPDAADDDDIRQSFVQAWSHLAPVFRNLSREMHGAESLHFLGFIAAGDAIQALDRVGSLSGWSVSVDGLRRLARMLIQDPRVDPLRLEPGVDAELRTIFDLGPALELPPAQRPADGPSDELLNWLGWVTREAVAEDMLDLDATVAGPDNIDRYLEDVRELLLGVAYGTLMIKPLDREYHKLFRGLVLATAWQETCWRQYQRSGDGIEPMRSSAGALGMMQVMPRVWRGFYDTDSLAGDIEYNAAAGSEILHRYLVRYALRKGEHKRSGGMNNLAKSTYAAYNGGPRHLARYRKESTPKSLRAIDRAFWEKFSLVKAGEELAVRGCYHY